MAYFLYTLSIENNEISGFCQLVLFEINHSKPLEKKMANVEEKAIKLKLRENRVARLKLKERRAQLKDLREQLKTETIKLREERRTLLAKSSELGIQFGKQAKAA